MFGSSTNTDTIAMEGTKTNRRGAVQAFMESDYRVMVLCPNWSLYTVEYVFIYCCTGLLC